MKITTKILVACLPAIVTGALFAASTGDRAVNKPDDSAMAKVKASMAKMPLSFEPNRGQTDPRVQFLSRGPGYTVFFTKDETVFSLKDTNTSSAVLRMRFVGGTNLGNAHPIDEFTNKSNYLIGNDSSKWVTGIAEYGKLRYEDVYPGIDVLYQGDQSHLRYDFIVKPGASASAIQMAFEGAENVSLTKDGDLAVTIDGKTLVTRKPLTYQEDGGVKKEVASHFVLKNGRVTFELAKYDTTKDVVIDPTVVFVTFLGGNLNDSVNGVAIVNPTLTIASQPSAYFVTGSTISTNFPTTAGVLPIGSLPGGLSGTVKPGVGTNVFVTKVSFNGAAIVWSTYLGGNSNDSANGIAVDAVSNPNGGTNCQIAGCPVIVGQTYSANFPVGGPFQVPSLSGTDDAFATKLNPNGTALIWSMYLGGNTNDAATAVTVDLNGNTFVGGWTDSPYFLCPQNVIPPVGINQCTNANHVEPNGSTDAFVVKIPIGFTGFTSLQSALYGGFGAETGRAIAYNPTNNMVYIAGDTTTGAQNYVAPNNINLPGITNNTVNQYTVLGAGGTNVTTGLPGPSPNARGGFVVAFDATTFARTFATYVAVGGYTGLLTTCGGAIGGTCNQGTEIITGIGAEGGAAATGCSSSTFLCTATSTATATIASTYGNIGHVYITGDTTSHVPTANIAVVAPSNACASPLIAASNQAGGPIIGPNGTPVVIPGGFTTPAGCTTALITQAPFNANAADTSQCQYPLNFPTAPATPSNVGLHCNYSAYVAVLDGALLTVPGNLGIPIGNQIEYWAYYSSSNASTVSNALGIDSNPTTLDSVYSLGTYQQMYITGSTQNTGAGTANALPMTNTQGPTEIFLSYNVGTTTGGGVGGFTPFASTVSTETDAYVARFNPNGLIASAFGGQGATTAFPGVGVAFPNMGYGLLETTPPTQPNDHSYLIHTPQFNFGEFLYSLVAADGSSTPNTAGNAIAVDPTRAVVIGGSTNVSVSPAGKICTPITACNFSTVNNLPAVGGQNNGGNDGWVAVLFFNDILTNAGSQSTANPFLQPGFPLRTPNTGTTAPCAPGGTVDGLCTYIEATPPPFGPTFDFAISDPSTQTQTFQVLFTGQTSGELVGQTNWYIPTDPRTGNNQPTLANGNPGSGIAYYVPCDVHATGGSNVYPAPGSAYGPQTCTFPDPTHLYEKIPMLYSGWPGLSSAQVAAGNLVTPGWLLVSQDVGPVQNTVRLQLDRRAAAGLLEGTYVAQFLVTTYDSQHNTQWPPCGPQSTLNPFIPTPTCSNQTIPLPADNVSILVTVRLVVRPSLFLSRNSGILTGVTSSLAANPLFGVNINAASITTQQGTSQVPDWYYTGQNPPTVGPGLNDISTWPAGAFGLGTILTAGNNGVNSNQNVCAPGNVNGTTVANVNPIVPQLGNPANPVATPNSVTIPCPVTALAPNTWGTTPNPTGEGASAYTGNGPGDNPSAPGTAPNINFTYDSGTVLSITPAPLTACNKFAADITNNTAANECNLSIEQNLAPSRPDQPVGVTTFNADWQGGQDPLTQRNDATVHDYYVSAEGNATISVAAINCIGWGLQPATAPGAGTLVHNNAIGNWLAVQMGAVSVNALGASTTANYTPICTDLSPTTVGTVRAPATGCTAGCTYKTGATIGDDSALPGAVGGQKIVLDFLAKAFTGGCSGQGADAAHGSTSCTTSSFVGPRSSMNGIPTGLYTASVYVWSTRAKNSVPGYCLGESAPASSAAGLDPTPLCGAGTSTAIASSANPNPEVLIQNQQSFTVSLFVFDSTQVIQITPNTCPQPNVSTSFNLFSTIGGNTSENDFTGNIEPPYGPGSVPNYANFGNNGSQLVEWSLLPFQTTGAAITGCFQPGVACPVGTDVNTPVALPQGVVVNAQTLAQYNACQLPTGTFNGSTVINGLQVPGIGSLAQVGPVSQTSFIPSANSTNAFVTIYACRPTVAPAWLNSPLYPGNNLTFPGGPEPYANGNGPWGGGSGTVAEAGCSATGDPLAASYTNCATKGQAPVPSVTGLTCNLAPNSNPGGGGQVFATTALGIYRPGTSGTGASILEDTSRVNNTNPGPFTFIQNFFSGFNGIAPAAGDLAVAGDWTGVGHAHVGVYRPSTGQWFLDTNNDGVYDAGDTTYNFGGIAGDIPVVGDWAQTGKACVGLFRQGFLWVLDAGCTGSTASSSTVTFPFGGIAGDVPVVGAWTGAGTRVAVVRKYAPGGVPQGVPFFWVLDGASATAGSSAASHPVATGALAPFAFGGLACTSLFPGCTAINANASPDMFVSGDWLGTGTYHAGVYRAGLWIEDTTGAHTYDTSFPFGGVTNDQPIPAKW